MLVIAGISIALFISALLLSKSDKSKPDYILLIWMIILAVHLAYFHLFFNGELYKYPILLGFQFPLPLLHGVFLYYYVSSVTHQLPKRNFSLILHLIPTLAAYIYLIPFMLLPAAEKVAVFKSGGQGYEAFQLILLTATSISGIVYFIWSLILLKKHKERIQSEFSTLEKINLNWLRFLTYGLGLVWLLVIFTQNDGIIFIGVSIFVILIGFFGLQQKEIFGRENKPVELDLPVLEKNEVEVLPTEVLNKEKYAKSGLTEDAAVRHYAQLMSLMKDKELYKNADLSLSQLALELGIHSNYLSQIINEKEGKSFYDFVNYFRIEEFKHLIAQESNQQYTLMTVAFDCGFNSKSSFNRHFKKNMNMTPTEYLKSVRA